METSEKSARREVFNYNRKFKEQLLSIKMKLENLQSEYGCSPNFLLIFEDNVTEKVNLRGRDSLTAGRTLCCGEGSLKDQFAKGEINFQPERMSFIRKGSRMQVDQSFLQDWAESLSRGMKRKRDYEEDANESRPSKNPPDPTLGLLEPKLELLEPQVELREEGLSGTEVKKEEVKKEEGIKQEPVESLEEMNLAAMIRDETVKISVGNLLLQNSEDKRFSKIDPQLVKNAADARKRDYSMQELLAQASGGGMFSCGFCEFKTYCSKRLAVHVRSIHGYGAKKLVCRECGFSTLIKQEMGQHMKEHKRDLIKCNVDWCNFFTFDPEQSLLHAAQHREDEKNSSSGGGMKTQTMSLGFQCSSCPFKSSSKKGIKVHENRIDGKDKQVFGTGSSSAASSSSVQNLTNLSKAI